MDPYGFVLLVVVLSVFVQQYLAIRVGMARKKYNVPLPDQYTNDKDKKIFNCYQRGLGNMLENYTGFLVLLLVGGQVFPIISACAGVVWLLGRILYAHGYYSGDPEKRLNGAIQHLGLLILLGCSIANALDRLGVVDI